jgi:hypothetical protein
MGSHRRDEGYRRDEGSHRRDEGSHRRDEGSQRRDEGSHRRDEGSQRRDEGSQRRDEGSQRRDEGSQRRDEGSHRRDKGSQRQEKTSQRPNEGFQNRHNKSQDKQERQQVMVGKHNHRKATPGGKNENKSKKLPDKRRGKPMEHQDKPKGGKPAIEEQKSKEPETYYTSEAITLMKKQDDELLKQIAAEDAVAVPKPKRRKLPKSKTLVGGREERFLKANTSSGDEVDDALTHNNSPIVIPNEEYQHGEPFLLYSSDTFDKSLSPPKEPPFAGEKEPHSLLHGHHEDPLQHQQPTPQLSLHFHNHEDPSSSPNVRPPANEPCDFQASSSSSHQISSSLTRSWKESKKRSANAAQHATNNKLFKWSWEERVTPFFATGGDPIGFWRQVNKPVYLPAGSSTMCISARNPKCWFEFNSNWEPKLCSQLANALKASPIPWQLAYYDLFAPEVIKDNVTVLPKPQKLALHFRADDGPKYYFPHPPGHYAFQSQHESSFPLVKQLREAMEKELGYRINWISILLYFDEKCQILPHGDCDQQIGYEHQQEIVATLCLYGPKLMCIACKETDEKLYFLHQPNQVYVMKGIQQTHLHSKRADPFTNRELLNLFPQLRYLKDKSHISMIFRHVKNWDDRPAVPQLYTPVQVHWENLGELRVLWNKHDGYFGLKAEEPVGHEWKSRYDMNHYGSFKGLICGFDTLNERICAIIDNVYGNTYIGTTLHYWGHASKDVFLKSYNRIMLLNCLDSIGIRLYVGANSKHLMAKKDRFVFVGLYYVIDFKLKPFSGIHVAKDYGKGFSGKRKDKKPKKYQWQFLLIPQTEYNTHPKEDINHAKKLAKFVLQRTKKKELKQLLQSE